MIQLTVGYVAGCIAAAFFVGKNQFAHLGIFMLTNHAV
jgi:hypothetical protein